MKKITLLLIGLVLSFSIEAQKCGPKRPIYGNMQYMNCNGFWMPVVIGDDTAKSSAILDLESDSLGILIPRMSSSKMAAIVSPETGLLIYNTSVNAFHWYNGSAWVMLGSGDTVSASNGLTETNGAFKLGGTLSDSTQVNTGTSALIFNRAADSITFGIYHGPDDGEPSFLASHTDSGTTYFLINKLHGVDDNYGVIDLAGVKTANSGEIAAVGTARLRGSGLLSNVAIYINARHTYEEKLNTTGWAVKYDNNEYAKIDTVKGRFISTTYIVPGYTSAVPVRKDTITVTTQHLALEPAGALDSLYITFPQSPINGQTVRMVSTATITTVIPLSATLYDNSTSFTLGTTAKQYVYDTTAGKWILF